MSASPQPPPGYKLCPQCRQIYPAKVDLCPRDQARLIVERRILVGKYILQSRIGAGPRSEVYAAEQPQLGRMVTIKLLTCEPAELDHFDTEVRSIGNIKHEHVVTLYDSGRAEDGRPYIAMEHLEGEDLARHLDRSGPLASERAFILWRQTVSAIAAAHRRNIVHGDLKPRNLFLTHKESAEGPIEIVKVTDFAIGKSLQLSADELTVRGAENTRYAAPERLLTGEATLRTDVYSLGMLLLEMLNGSLELGGEAEVSRVSHIRQLVQRQQRVKTNGRRALSQELEDLLGNVLHKDPARRPADAGALLQLIRQLPEGAFAPVSAGGRSAEAKAPLGIHSTKPEWPTQLRPDNKRSDEAAVPLKGADEPPPHYVANETPQMGVALLSDLLKQVKAREPGAFAEAPPEPPEPPAPPRSRPGLRIVAILVLGLGGAAGLLAFYSRVPVLTAGRTLTPVQQGVADLGSARQVAASDLLAVSPLDLTAAPADLTTAAAAPGGDAVPPADRKAETEPADPREIKVRFVYSEEDAVDSIECGQESQLLLKQSDKRSPGVEAAIRPGGSCRATGPYASKSYKYESLVGKHPDASGFRRVHVRLSNEEGEELPAPSSKKSPAPKPIPATPLPRPPGPELDSNGS